MSIVLKPYFDTDFLRVRDFLSANAREVDGAPTRRPGNWWIDRWNFTSVVACGMHGTDHDRWAAGIGLWHQDGEIIGAVLHEGERRGEAFIASGRDELPRPVLGEMLDFLDLRGAAINLRIDGLWVGSDQPFYLAVGFRVMSRWPIWRNVP